MTEPENQVIIRDEKGRFVEGQSGNPAGKPRGTLDFQTRLVNKILEYPMLKNEETGESYLSPKDKLEIIYDVLVDLARKGNMFAIRELFDRLMGKAPQKLEHSGNVGLLTYEQAIELLERKYEPDTRTISQSGNSQI